MKCPPLTFAYLDFFLKGHTLSTKASHVTPFPLALNSPQALNIFYPTLSKSYIVNVLSPLLLSPHTLVQCIVLRQDMSLPHHGILHVWLTAGAQLVE